MTTPRLFIAPPATGKTEYVLATARAQSQGLTRQPIICVPTPVQVRSASARLAAMGGAVGIHIFTFDQLFSHILKQRSIAWLEPSAAALRALMRQTLDQLAKQRELKHFGAIAHTQGLVDLLGELVGELKRALVDPDELALQRQALILSQRVADVARVYGAWQRMLDARGWVDREGVGWLALEALRAETSKTSLARTPLYFDGFDFFTELQVQTITALAAQPDAEVTITLTGIGTTTDSENAPRPATRFDVTRARLESTLGIRAEHLRDTRPLKQRPVGLRQLHDTIIAPERARNVADPTEAGNAASNGAGSNDADTNASLVMLEATVRQTEIRAALRWIKRAIVEEGTPPEACALLMRDSTAYRRPVQQIAAEFGLPVAIEGGAPLLEDALVAWLLTTLNAVRPDAEGDPSLPRDAVLDIWSAPWLDRARLGAPEDAAEQLDMIAQRALLIGGAQNWQRALARFGIATVSDTGNAESASIVDPEPADGEDTPPVATPVVDASVQQAFGRWLTFVTPPASNSVAGYVRWMQRMIAEIALLEDASAGDWAHPLAALFEVLRSMQWTAEHMPVAGGSLSFDEFLRQLTGALEAAHCRPPEAERAIFVGTIVEARGIPFAAVAICGLAEGELPQHIGDDPILRDEERRALSAHFPGIQLQAVGIEREYFEEALSRAELRLLLTRPLLADGGTASEPSPYWQEIRATLQPPLLHERAGLPPMPINAASLPEMMRVIAASRENDAVTRWTVRRHGQQIAQMRHGAQIVVARTRGPADVHNGNLRGHNRAVQTHFPNRYVWSPTGIEQWIDCHYRFFASRVLALEPPSRPEDGVAPWQIGEIYHAILQDYYRPGAHDEGDAASALDAIIARHLRAAPEELGFLNSPLWQIEARNIDVNVRRTIAALDALPGHTVGVEEDFGGENALQISVDEGGSGDPIRVRGTIDRVDLLPDGTYRVIDYKSGKGKYASPRALAEGKRLQLALYAMALEQNTPGVQLSDALYFFVHQGEAATWSLATFEGGKERAFAIAADAVREATRGIRAGSFEPRPPDEGCPDFCPARVWCWSYTPRR